jgi:hypothetical protein
MSRLSRPLNKAAVRAADDAFYAGHPELIKNGKGLPLSNQADLQKEWRELYIKNGGKVEADKQVPDTKPDAIVQPCPAGKNVAKKAGSTIILDGTPDEIKRMEAILENIRKTAIGRQTLEAIDNSGKQVTIRHDAASRATAGSTSSPNRIEASDGTGTDATILFDTTIPDHGSHWVFDSAGNQIDFTADQNLFHELVHAKHDSLGTLNLNDPEGQAIGEENIFRQQEVLLPAGYEGPTVEAPQRHGHAGTVRP